MPELLDLLSQQLGGERVNQLSQEIGADEASTQSALSAALPLLIGGLSRNVEGSSEGARSLDAALDEDHDGSLLDNLGSFLGGGSGAAGGLLGAAASLLGGGRRQATDGQGILRHVLGGQRTPVERGISRASGLDDGKVSSLLTLLAPLVMSALGRVKRQQNLGADGLSALLERERSTLEQRAPATSPGGLLELFNTRDDGQLSETVAQLGRSLGAGLFGNSGGKRS
ncbi:hypothetical protein BH24DEI1_BH24DEI1_00520 [soil metagenome]|nr:DUF937 domain-containing protein [Deinococcota bacterium]